MVNSASSGTSGYYAYWIDNAIDSTPLLQKKKIYILFTTTSNPRILHILKHVEKFTLHDFKKNLLNNLHEELRSHFLYIAKSIETTVCLHLSFIVHKLLYFLLFILHLISQAHYINNVTFHKKKSHAIHTNLICIERSCNGRRSQTDS